jgi:DNA-binding IclR family transcriptional regulator
MSQTLMRGLSLLETVDMHGPITITELSRHSGVDISIVSRTIAALEQDGWVVRNDGKVELGPRAALLGHTSAGAGVVRQAEPLVHAIAGVTGMLAQAYGLVGTRAVVLAAAGGRGMKTDVGLGISVPLFATAAGKMIAAQLNPSELTRRLPVEPYPDPAEELARLVGYRPLQSTLLAKAEEQPSLSTQVVARHRKQLDRELETIRNEGIVSDDGELDPELGCIAVPWSQPGVPSALACLGRPADIAANEAVVRTALLTAAGIGAQPEDVVAETGKLIGELARSRTAP